MFHYPIQYPSMPYGAAPAGAAAAFSPETVACMQQELRTAKTQGRKANPAKCLAHQPTYAMSTAAPKPASSGMTWLLVLGGLAIVGGGAYWYMTR